MFPLNLGLFHQMVHLEGRGSANRVPRAWLAQGSCGRTADKDMAAVLVTEPTPEQLSAWHSGEAHIPHTLSYSARWDHLFLCLSTHLLGKESRPWGGQGIVFGNHLTINVSFPGLATWIKHSHSFANVTFWQFLSSQAML